MRSLLTHFSPKLLSRETIAALVFFGLYLSIGWYILPDYGLSWDEFLQRRYGLHSYDFLVKTLGLDWPMYFPQYHLETSAGRQYSIIFSLIAAGFEKLAGIDADDFHAQYLLRHRMLFLLFWTATISFYQLLRLRFDNALQQENPAFPFLKNGLPLLGTLLLILTPRIFAHSFFNPKDIVLLSFYTISLYTLIRYLKSPTLWAGLIHGLACAFVVNSRIAGIIVPLLSVGFIGLQLIKNVRTSGTFLLRQYVKSFPVFFLVFILLAVAFFPYLWNSVGERATETFSLMSNFPKSIHTLFFGHYISSNPPPFYYPYAWMAITLPLLNLFLLPVGIFWLIKTLTTNLMRRKLWTSFPEFIDLITFAFLSGPLFAVWLFHSTLYDGWRHFYFIYPPALMLGLVPLDRLWRSKSQFLRRLTMMIVLVSFLYIGYKMVKLHPHQQVYFNILAGDHLTERFEMDYWGVAYKQAFEELVRRDTTGKEIHVFCANQPCFDNYFALPEEIKSHIRMRYGMEVAQYYLTNYRFRQEMEKFCNGEFPFDEEYFSIMADGERIIGVYKVERLKVKD